MAKHSEEFIATATDPDDVDRLFDRLAGYNDTLVLQRVATRKEGMKILDLASNGDRPRVTYAVSHMLVDNGGNDDFALQWLADTGHTPELAAIRFKNLIGRDITDKLMQQRILGLAKLVDIFSPQADGLEPYLDMVNMGGNTDLRRSMCRLMAAVLRTSHPLAPPDVQQSVGGPMIPLIRHMWTDPMMNRFLPAIGYAYGRGNKLIDKQMSEGALEHIEKGHLRLVTSPMDASWESLDKWAGKPIWQKLWHAKTASGDSFLDELIERPNATDLLRKAVKHGVQLDAVVFGTKLGGLNVNESGMGVRVLDIAVSRAKADVVEWLLKQGCDPTLKTVCKDQRRLTNAVEIAENLEMTSKTSHQSMAALRVASAIRATATRNSATAAAATSSAIAP